MTISLALSILVALIAGCYFYWGKNERLRELARLSFAAGMLAALLQLHGGMTATFFK